MPEPVDAPLHRPVGGWPKALVRLELEEAIDRERAAYELACASRRFRQGVVASVNGIRMVGYPHQTADEIARTYLGMVRAAKEAREMTAVVAEETVDLAVNGRWTVSRKLALLALVASGVVSTEKALVKYGVDTNELEEWARSVSVNGAGGLQTTKIQRNVRG